MAAGNYPYFTPISEAKGNRVKVHGREMILIGSIIIWDWLIIPKLKKQPKRPLIVMVWRPAGDDENTQDDRCDCRPKAQP